MEHPIAFGGCTCPCHTDPEAAHAWTCCWPGFRQPTPEEEVLELEALWQAEDRKDTHTDGL